MRKILLLFLLLLLLLPSIMPPAAEAETVLPFGMTISGTISASDPEDVYKITIPQSGTLTINLKLYFSAALVQLRESNKSLWNSYPYPIYGGTPDEPSTSTYQFNLEAGEYYFVVKEAAFTGYGDYQLDASFQPATFNEIEPNQSMMEAMPLQVNGDRVKGFLSLMDQNDYYKVELTEPGLLLMVVRSDIMLGAEIALYDAKGGFISDDHLRKRNNEPINGKHYINLEAGTYYFRVNSSGGPYEVGATLTPANNEEVEPNNDKQMAINILIDKTYTGFLSFSDKEDYYQFEMPYDGYLTIDFTSVSNSFYIKGLDTDNSIAYHSSYGDIGKPEVFSQRIELKKGTYYFITTDNWNRGVYQFTLRPDNIKPLDTIKPGIFWGTLHTFPINSTFHPMTGVTAKDSVDGDLTSRINVMGSVNTNKIGLYELFYTVSDKAGNIGTATRNVKIIDNVKPIITGATSKTLTIYSTFNIKTGVFAKDNVDGDLTRVIKVTGTVNTRKKGIYTLTYTVSDKSGNTSTITRKITVIDKIKPVILGANNKTIKLYSQFNSKTGVTAKDNLDGNLTSKIKVTGTVNTKKKGIYTLTYTATDSSGNKATIQRKITVR